MKLRTLTTIATLALLPTLGAQPADAADARSKYKLRGLGAFTCSHYLEDRRKDIKATEIYAHWFTGYLTAYNYFQPQTFDIAPNHDANSLLTYLDLYCSRNGTVLIGVAVQRFVSSSSVYDSRQVTGQ